MFYSCRSFLLRALYAVFRPSCNNFREGREVVFSAFDKKIAKNDFWAFRNIDAARRKNVIESSETSHLVENWLLYHSTLLKQNLFASSEC